MEFLTLPNDFLGRDSRDSRDTASLLGLSCLDLFLQSRDGRDKSS